jgi:hypothetical protein
MSEGVVGHLGEEKGGEGRIVKELARRTGRSSEKSEGRKTRLGRFLLYCLSSGVDFHLLDRRWRWKVAVGQFCNITR